VCTGACQWASMRLSVHCVQEKFQPVAGVKMGAT
jgi:hypothetical protein